MSENKETVEFLFPLGSRVKDRVTEMVGILDARLEALNGCIRYSVQPQVSEPSDTVKTSWWIDEAQLELVDAGLNLEPVAKNKTGGPMESSQGAKQYV